MRERDRRAAERLQPRKDIQLIFNCHRPIIGSVYDISAKGLAVEYEGACRIDVGREIFVSIVNDGKDAEMLSDLRCITVYNIPTLAHGRSFSGKNVHLLGMAYGDMDPARSGRLHHLLETLT